MQPTPDLGFYLVEFHEFWCLSISAGGSGNIEERPTCWVYIEILTCHTIFYHLEDSEATGTNGKAIGPGGRAPALPPLGARPVAETN